MENYVIERARKKLPYPVYLVQSNTDGTVLIGTNVTIEIQKYDGTEKINISWLDPHHQRSMTASEIFVDGDIFFFTRTIAPDTTQSVARHTERHHNTSVAHHYKFTPLDLDTYNQAVRPLLLNAPHFDDTKEMLKYFLYE